ncbi:MAG: response regulator, partial [Proteobacteria bacterium]|nr:response regulator [Pseudomonadota bacterium]
PADATIRVTVDQDGDRVRIEVDDEDTGIAPDELELVFDPFYTTKEPGEGTGLGLSSVKGIVEEASGEVWLETLEAGGTRAVVLLPSCELPERPRPCPSAKPGTPSLGGPIVLVDDNAPLLRSLARRLSKQGLAFQTYSDPLEARDAMLAADEPPGLLISDIVMPGLNGAQLVEAVRVRWPELPVLFMSGYSSDVLGETTLGDVELLEKPFSPEALAAAIARVVPADGTEHGG